MIWKHKLHVINTDHADIVVVDTCSQSLKYLLDWCRPIEIHKSEIVLFEFFNDVSCMVYVFGLAVIKLRDHCFSQDFVLDFEATPKGWESLGQEVDWELRKECGLARARCSGDKCELAFAQTAKCFVEEIEILGFDAQKLICVHDAVY